MPVLVSQVHMFPYVRAKDENLLKLNTKTYYMQLLQEPRFWISAQTVKWCGVAMQYCTVGAAKPTFRWGG